MAINYGYNKVRFITPGEGRRQGPGARGDREGRSARRRVQAMVTTTVEIEGSDKPAAVAESIVRFLG